MNNCYVNVSGGVGNQLFQLAAGYGYSRKYGKDMFVNPAHWTASQGVSPVIYQSTIFRNFSYWRTESPAGQSYREPQFNYNEIPFIDGNLYINGYFQSLKYFNDWKSDFVNEICLPLVDTTFIGNDDIAFHIRIGDYKHNPTIFGDLRNYFHTMFEKFQSNRNINVFTDSPDSVLRDFEKYDFKLIQTSSELSDLALLSAHSNMVCSNSTFSWWGSLLGVEKELIIVPNIWLLDRDCSDIYYEGMTKYEL